MIGWEDYLAKERMRSALAGDVAGTLFNADDNFFLKRDFIDGIRDGWGDAQLGQPLIPVSGMKTVCYRMGYSHGGKLWKKSIEEGMNVKG